jgi:hypothetical protein
MRVNLGPLVADTATYSCRDKVEFTTKSRVPSDGEIVTVRVGKQSSLVRVESASLGAGSPPSVSVTGRLIRRSR